MASLLIWLLTRPVAFISWAAGGPRQAAAEAVAMVADQPALVAVADQLVDGHQQQQQRNPEFHTPPPPGRRYPGALDGVQLAPVGPAAGGPPAPVGQGFDQLRAYQLWMEVGAWDRYRYLQSNVIEIFPCPVVSLFQVPIIFPPKSRYFWGGIAMFGRPF
jgi:hypothetical protein